MPTLMVKLYSVFYKYHQKHLLQILTHNNLNNNNNNNSDDKIGSFGITSRPNNSTTIPCNPSFKDSSVIDGVATKDIHVDPSSSLSLRIFLPQTAVSTPTNHAYDATGYSGYSPPPLFGGRKLPVIVQFHGGGFVGGSNVSVENDAFCKRIARSCDAVVVAVGYRLAPESKFPGGGFEDGVKVLYWLAKQANLAAIWRREGGGGQKGRFSGAGGGGDGFGASLVEPWLAVHGDFSR